MLIIQYLVHCNVLKYMKLFLKILSGMANIVDLIRLLLQEQSDLGLHCLHMPFCQKLCVQNFRVSIFVYLV